MNLINAELACLLATLIRGDDKNNVEKVITKLEHSQYENLDDFIRVLNWFIDTPYAQYLHIDFEDRYIFATINSPSLLLGFCNETDDWDYYYLNGKICFEHNKLFDKWSNSCTPLFLPKTKTQFDAALNLINYISSDEYYKLYSLDYEDVDDESSLHLYKAVEDFTDWSNHIEECIPVHLRHLYKEESYE